MLQVTIATMCNNNNQQQQQQQDLSPCGSLDAADKVLMKPPPVASNESVLQHFQQGNTRLYSYAQQTEATARQVLANKMVRPRRKIIFVYLPSFWLTRQRTILPSVNRCSCT